MGTRRTKHVDHYNKINYSVSLLVQGCTIHYKTESFHSEGNQSSSLLLFENVTCYHIVVHTDDAVLPGASNKTICLNSI